MPRIRLSLGNPVTQGQLTALTGTFVAKGALVVNVMDYCVGDGATDDGAAMDAALAALPASGGVLFSPPNKIYYTARTTGFTITRAGQTAPLIDFNASTIYAPNVVGTIFTVTGTINQTLTSLTANAAAQATAVTVPSAAVAGLDDLLYLHSSGEVFNDDRPTVYYKGEFIRVLSVSGTTINIRGELEDSYDATGYTVAVGRVNAAKTVRIRNLRIRGGGSGADQFGLVVNYFDGLIMEGCESRDCETIGIRGFVGLDFSAFGCRAEGSNRSGTGYGFSVVGVERATLVGCHGRKNRHSFDADYAAGYVKAKHIKMLGCTATDDSSCGLSTHGGAEHVTIEACSAINCGGGIITRGAYTTVKDSKVRGTRVPAQSSETYVSGILVGDDSPNAWGNGRGGINYRCEGNTVDITNPNFIDTTGRGLYITSKLKNAKILDNTFIGFSGHGIYAKGDGADVVTVRGNDLDCSAQVGSAGNSIHAVYIAPGHAVTGNKVTRARVIDNDIKNPLGSCVVIGGNVDNAARSDNLVIRGNTMSGHGLVAVDLSSGYFGSALVNDNELPTATQATLIAWTPANFVTVPTVRRNRIGTNIGDEFSPMAPIVFRSGKYHFVPDITSTATSNALSNGNLRLHMFAVSKPISLTRIGAEITAAGEAGSVFRLGIYADNGNGYPGALVVDAGTIDGTSVTVQEITINATLNPGIYWIGGAVQAAPTTQPTLRVCGTITSGVGYSTIPGVNAISQGYQQGSVTGALPSTFTTSETLSGSLARIFVKVA